jgi:hypothetical protein
MAASASATSFGRSAAAAATASGCSWLEGSNRARRLLLVLDGDAPFLLGILASGRRSGARRRAIVLLHRFAACVDGRYDIEGLVLANDDVIAACVDSVAGSDRDPSIAVAADHLQSADNASANQVAVVQPVLREQVRLFVVEISF